MADLNKELSSFWSKFSKMIDAGAPLLKSLETIILETGSGEMVDIISVIAERIRDGGSLSDAMESFSDIFPPTMITMVRSGEVAGRVDVVMHEIVKGFQDGSWNIDARESKRIQVNLEGAEDHEKAPIVKVLNLVLLDAIEKNASDIHFEWTSKGLRIRLRIDGVLTEIEAPPEHLHKALISRIKVMAALDVAEKRAPQDGRVTLKIKGKDIDLRVSTAPSIIGEGVVIRILMREKVDLNLDKMNFCEANLEKVRQLIHLPHGTVILTGPTGCGKTTTLYSMLSEINSPGIKIITCEDPVEYQIDGLNQMAIRPAQGMTFERAIRSMLRQDPDVVMIGEIRNREIASLVAQVALTGHLAFTTLHTNDSVSAIRRLLDIGIAPFLVNSSLSGVVSQRLVRQVCQNCKEEYKPEDWVKEMSRGLKDQSFYKGKGCDTCSNTGFKGRLAVQEVLVLDNDIRRLIMQDAESRVLKEQAVENGLITLQQDGFEKAGRGLTTLEEVLRVLPVE